MEASECDVSNEQHNNCFVKSWHIHFTVKQISKYTMNFSETVQELEVGLIINIFFHTEPIYAWRLFNET